MDWLFAPIDPGRAHVVDLAVAWHARIMVLAWGIIAPLAVLMARFFKVLPWQDWPTVLDNKVWWRSHLFGQSIVFALTALGLALIVPVAVGASWHGLLGYSVVALLLIQVGLGVFRGSKGGPTAPAPDGSLRGDHYDMTRRRLVFEAVHKTLGYLLLALATFTIVFGLWHANAPRWMWLTLTVWWVVLIAASTWLQRQGRAIDTYQAIWGPGREHPGNTMAAHGWGMRRIDGAVTGPVSDRARSPNPEHVGPNV